jgi:hypothetical protein
VVFVQRDRSRLRLVLLPLINVFATLAFVGFGGATLWLLGYDATLHCDRPSDRCVARSGFAGLLTNEHEFPLSRVVRGKTVFDERHFGDQRLGLRNADGTLSWLHVSTPSRPLGGDPQMPEKLAAFLADPAQATFDVTTDSAIDRPGMRWIGGVPFLFFGVFIGIFWLCLGVIDVDLDERKLRRRTWRISRSADATVALGDVERLELDVAMETDTSVKRWSYNRRRLCAVLRLRDGSTLELNPETTNWRGDPDRVVALLAPVLEGRLE